MVKRGISGGLLSIESLLDKNDRIAMKESSMVRTSSALREAAKIGLQSLYADVDDILEKYKDFDIIKEMKSRKGANLLWVRARAIDADVCNTNGDYFSEEELTKEVDIQGKKMPAYKTFEGVPIYTNHKNDNIEEAKGMVVYAEWDDEEKCVYCVFFIDEDAYPDIARGIRHGYIKDVSMGCFDGNTKIPTSNGFKKIIDVNEEDQLFDTNGNLVKIINRQEYDHFEKIHLVTLEGGHQIKCTDYHPFLVLTKDQWSNRKSLKSPKDSNGKKMSKWEENDISPNYIRLENLKPGDMFLSPIGGTIIDDLDFNVNRAKLIGYFLAEGSYSSKKNHNSIYFTFNLTEKDSYAQEVVDLIREEFDVEAKIFVPKDKNYCRVTATNEKLKDWFFDNCGRWSSKKKLNSKWLQAPYEIQKAFVGAWIDGDGTSTIDKRNGNTYLRATTTSIELFDQMSFILSRLGVYHSCYFAYKSKKFNYIDLESFEDFHPQCIIQIPSYATCGLEGYLHKTICPSTLNKNKHTYKNFLARKIISIEEIPIKQQKVYTFQTESGNYLAHNFISKNCSVDYGVCSICGNKATTERDYCFAPGALITMSDGSLKNIEKIEIGDEILSHTGSAKRVKRLSVNHIKDNVLKISANGSYLPLVVTQNHPFLGVSKDNIFCKRDKRQVCKPGELGICFTGQKINSGTQSCASNDKNLEPTFIHSGCLEIGDYVQSVRPIRNTNHLNLNFELAKFSGYYMAEGCLHQTSNSIILSLNKNENELIEDLEKICLNLPEEYKSNYKFRHETNKNNNSLSWRWSNKNLKNWLQQNCIGKAVDKKISKELFEDLCSNQDLAFAFLSGFIDGDGHQGEKNIKVQLRTASPHLTNQLVQILSTLNIKASTFLQAQSGGPTNREKICYIWHVNINGIDASNFIDKTIKVKTSSERPNTRFIKSEYGFLTPIYDIEKFYYEGPVYNFSVEDDESYIANGIAVHNCECLKKYKGKMHPAGKRAFEYNYGIKFIELSCVGDGAFESCEILEIYDQEDILEKAKDTIKTAQALNSSISLAASINEDISSRREIENALRQLQTLNGQIIKIAQAAGTLVGGQLLSGGATQNSTVAKILQSLGIDPSGQLNVLDLVNLALNFLEVAVMNLFAKKDNIDLGHVAKLTKAMGELQNTLQDMIDDGIETGGQKAQQPLIPPQQAPQSPATPNQNLETQPAFFQNNVGTMVSPFEQQPYVMPLGGGVSAKTHGVRFVWASTNEQEDIQFEENKLNKLGKLAKALENLKEACGVSVIKAEGNNLTIQKNKIQETSGEKNIMDNFKKIAQDYKKQNTVALAIDIKLDDPQGNRIVLSTDKGIKGFYKGSLTNWSPNLTDVQLSQMENGDGYRVASELLKDFSNVIKIAEKDKTIDHLMVLDELVDQDREYVHPRAATEILDMHTGADSETLNEKLNSKRNNTVHNTVLDELISAKRTDELVRIVTKLSEDAKKGLGQNTLEEMLHPDMSKSSVSGYIIMSNVLSGLAKTAQKHNLSGKQMVSEILSLAENDKFPALLKLARLGKDARECDSILNKFAQNTPLPGAETTDVDADNIPTDAVTDIADTATPDTSEGDIMSALNVIRDSFQTAIDKLDTILGKKEDDKTGDMQDALTGDTDTDADSMKGAVTGLSLAGEDTGATPSQLVGAVNSMPTDSMAKQVQLARYPATTLSSSKNEKTASKNDLSTSITNWLARVANESNLSTDKVVLSAKLFCSYKEAAEKILTKSIRTAEVKVTDETSHTTTIYATLDDLGFDVKDAAFNQKFRDYAVDLLSKSGYDVDPHTFALTEISVDENGMVCGKVSTRATKTYMPEDTDVVNAPYVDEDRDKMMVEPMSPELESHIEASPNTIMTASAKNINRLARLENIVKVAQGLGLPGSPTPGGAATATGAGGAAAGAGALDPTTSGMDAGMAGGAGDLGVSSLTGASTPDTSIDAQPEPGNKQPWGTICPQCGSQDIDIADGEGNCNSCNARLKYKFIVEVAPPDEKGEMKSTSDTMTASAPMPPVGGIGAPGATPSPLAGAPTGGAAPGAAGGVPSIAAKANVMVKVAYKTSAEVYANALREGFDKTTTERLPVGMICPGCGSRNASKKQKHTYCYNCGTLSISEVKKVKGEPGILEASIVWI
jgi:intein/homing endonuclease